MEDKDTKDMPPVHLILGASDYFKINTENTPRMGALVEPIGEKAKFVGLLCYVELFTMFFMQTSSADYERLCWLDLLGLANVVSRQSGKCLCRM